METNNINNFQNMKREKQKLKRFMSIKRFMSLRANISYVQILIMIVSIFAFCYLLSSATEGVSAQGLDGYACCEKTLGGNICQFNLSSSCDPGFNSAPTECKNTGFCKEGCCITEDGFCSESSIDKNCEGGTWSEDEFCNIPECQRGCCVLGNNAVFTTEKNCEVKAGFYGFEPDFRPEINSEIACIFLTEKDEEGSCVLGENCVFTTNGDCVTRNGDFYKNEFCSDLVDGCVAEDHTGCVEGEDSVYWFDSCGNKEAVAEECSLFTGDYCGQYRPGIDEEPDEGDYVCRSVNCKVDINGKTVEKKNGESWCEYDGTVGNGKDVVGSRHWKHICFMGEERLEACDDYRNQICVGTKTDLGNGESFSEAACRVNNWRSCLEYNTAANQEGVVEKCNENPDCKIQGVHIDKFSFDMCVPKYPAGFDLSSEASGKNAEMVCSMASQQCTVIYVKRFSHRKFVGWECEVNCACEDSGFTQQMNDLCVSLGDCGGYVNIAGKTDDAYTSGAGGIDLNQYKKYAQPNPNQKPASPGDLSFLGGLGVSQGDYEGGNYKFKNALGVYGVGFALQVASYMMPLVTSLGTYSGASLSQAISLAYQQGGSLAGAGISPSASVGAFGNALAAAGSAMFAASILSKAFGIDYGTALIITAVSVASYAAVTGELSFAGVTSILKTILPFLLIIYIAILLLGIGKTKKKIVSFQCMPWQAPTGGADCDKCNKEPLGGEFKPCSDYRCDSLGQTCELVNKGTEQQMCVDNSPTDVSSPRISPLFGVITEGYEYYNIQNNGFEIVDTGDKSCIPEFTPIEFGIKTDKPSQCKIGSSGLQSYEQMEEYFGGNLFLSEHTTVLNIPSPAAFKSQYNLTDEQIADLGEINFYVKCKSINGVVNSASYTIKSCVKPGPDLTAPRVANTEPGNGAYIAFNQTEQDLKIWINEPAECRYSGDDKNYELMENSFNCETDFEDYSLYGWACNITLTGLDVNSKFYIRCQDISENNNTMTQSYVYELSKSESDLRIEDFRPVNGGEIFSGVAPMTLELQVRTAGGAEDGKAKCNWEETNYGWKDQFTETYSDYHSYTWDSVFGGDYDVVFKCEDAAGNTAEASTSFEISIDNSGPRITRIYYDSGLKVFTNEEAECRYMFTKKFVWDDAEIMTGGGFEHSTAWQMKTYYIKCEDEYGNKGGRIAVKAYSLVG